MKDFIVVRGARQHNLKGFDLEIPRRAFTVITGPSGSGKSSLAFDTIYAEGQRRYVESLSAYARQFLERMEKPDVDSIDGLSPAVAIEQKNPTKTSRSTVGTATEIYDYLRLLWARVGRTFCPLCGREMQPGHGAVGHRRGPRAAGRHALLRHVSAAPLRRGDARSRRRESARAGIRARARRRRRSSTSTICMTEAIDVTFAKQLLVVVDRLAVGDEARGRLAGRGRHGVSRRRRRLRRSLFTEPMQTPLDAEASTHLRFTERYECANDGTRAPSPTPQLFSFNSPRGACDAAMDSARRSSMTNRSSFPTPRDRCATARSTRGRSRATTTSGARSPSSRSARASRWTRRGSKLPARSATDAAARERSRGYKGIFPFPRRSRGEEVQAVHPRLPAAVSDGAGVSRLPRHQAQAGGAAGSRRRRNDRRRQRAAGRSAARMARDARADASSSGRSPRTSSRKRATACSSSATSGSTTSR